MSFLSCAITAVCVLGFLYILCSIRKPKWLDILLQLYYSIIALLLCPSTHYVQTRLPWENPDTGRTCKLGPGTDQESNHEVTTLLSLHYQLSITCYYGLWILIYSGNHYPGSCKLWQLVNQSCFASHPRGFFGSDWLVGKLSIYLCEVISIAWLLGLGFMAIRVTWGLL